MFSNKIRLEIYGLLKSKQFHIAVVCAEDLEKNYPENFDVAFAKPMLDCEWNYAITKRLSKIERYMRGRSDSVICFDGDVHIGNHEALLSWAQAEWQYENSRPEVLYNAIAEEAYKDYYSKCKNIFVFMDVSVNAKPSGRFIFKLFDDVCPKTCENFRALCTGERGKTEGGLTLHYLHSLFHRVVPNGWIQGGDIFHSRGDAGESIYGKYFEDENFAIPHDSRGILGMANTGRHTNGSQFYVTLNPASWMDRKFVAFGVLIEGAKLLEKIEEAATRNERPIYDCRIQQCGVYTPDLDI